MKPLEGKIALVAGATRGAGRGIAMMLGEQGATVYCTGRSVRGKPATGTRPETIEETAELVTGYRGNLFYDLVKLSVIRLAYSMAWEPRRHSITALAVTPGFLCSEAMLELFGVTEVSEGAPAL